MVSKSWDISLVDTMEVLSVDCDPELLEDFFSGRFGVYGRGPRRCADCVGLLLQPWFSGEEGTSVSCCQGMAMSQGTTERITKELTPLAPSTMKIKRVLRFGIAEPAI